MAERLGSRSSEPPRAIADHAVIGNLCTMAPVGLDGTIDFMCWPSFDSPSLFAALLDPDIGGACELAPVVANARVRQRYLPDSNVLLTRWLGDDFSADIVDLMAAPSYADNDAPRLIRRVRVTRGRVRFALRCAPRFDYARVVPTVTVKAGEALFDAAEVRLCLRCAVEVNISATFYLDRALDGSSERLWSS